MDLEAEFTTEPFRPEAGGEPPAHASRAAEQARKAGLDTTFGPLGTTVRGSADEVLAALPEIFHAALAGGATRVTLRLGVAGSDEATESSDHAATESAPGRVTGDGPGLAKDAGPAGASGPGGDSEPAGASGLVKDSEPAGMSGLGDESGAVGVGALDRVIAEVESELGGSLRELSRADKQRAVRLLEERGAFEVRRSVPAVAEALGVTRFTVYNYLNRSQ